MKNQEPTRPIQQEEPKQGNESTHESLLTLENTEKPKLKSGLTRDELIEHRDMLIIDRTDLRLKVKKL